MTQWAGQTFGVVSFNREDLSSALRVLADFIDNQGVTVVNLWLGRPEQHLENLVFAMLPTAGDRSPTLDPALRLNAGVA